MTIEMCDYGGFEKVGALEFSLPTSDSHTTIEPCDLVLYQGKPVIFYGSNSRSYNLLGKIEGVSATELREVLDSGAVTVTLSPKK